MVDLFKKTRKLWVVQRHSDNESINFATIEAASEHMEKLGVPSDEIDSALISMSANGHGRANFGDLEGKFIFSDNKSHDELFGTA